MARNVDLSLDDFTIAGLYNFEHEFGSKKPDGNGLSTEEITNLDMLSFRHQQAIIADENLNCANKHSQCDRKFIFTSGGLTITIDKASFPGIKLTFIADFASSTSSIKVKNANNDYTIITISAGQVIELYADKDGYFKNYTRG